MSNKQFAVCHPLFIGFDITVISTASRCGVAEQADLLKTHHFCILIIEFNFLFYYR